jgi:glycosyltransferase involved in cell wall biosynthesis
MRLGIISGTPAARDARGRLWLNHSNGRTFEELRVRFPGARICLPVLPGPPQPSMNHELTFAGPDIAVLPPLASTLDAQRHLVATRRALTGFAATVDALFVRLPFQVPAALFGLGKPKLLHVVSDPRAIVNASTDYRGAWRLLARAFARHTEWAMARLVAEPDTRTVSNGEDMWKRLHARDGRVVVSSCLRAAELRGRAASQLGDPPRLLFVGYIRPEKGVGVLLEAFEKLRARRPLRLTLVGASDRESASSRALLDRVRDGKHAADVALTGMVDFGEPLFELYRQHDVFVLPSLSEGTPRTLVEARAFGCPVVASRVGGVPASVDEGRDGLLVPPGDAGALAATIERILDDVALRARLVEGGLERARRSTLERFVDQLAEELEALGTTQHEQRRACA